MATRRKSAPKPQEPDMTDVEESFDFEEVEPVVIVEIAPEPIKAEVKVEQPKAPKPVPRSVRRNVPRFTQVK
jgi:hypothetical protein